MDVPADVPLRACRVDVVPTYVSNRNKVGPEHVMNVQIVHTDVCDQLHLQLMRVDDNVWHKFSVTLYVVMIRSLLRPVNKGWVVSCHKSHRSFQVLAISQPLVSPL